MEENKSTNFSPRETKVVYLDRFRRFDSNPSDGNYNMFTVMLVNNGRVKFTSSAPDKSRMAVSLYPAEFAPIKETLIDPMVKAIKEGGVFEKDAELFIRSEAVDFKTKQRVMTEFRTGIKDKMPYISLRNADKTVRYDFKSFNETKISIGDTVVQDEAIAQLFFAAYWGSLISTTFNLYEHLEIDDVSVFSSAGDEKPVGVI